MSAAKPAPIEVFLSFAPEDQAMRDTLVMHLAQLEREGSILPWHEGKLEPGEEKTAEITRRLASADVVLLLVSANFIASNDRYEVDVKRAMERHARGDARVVPVVLRPCDWKSSVFGALEALPSGGKPVTTYENQDAAFAEIAEGLRAIVKGASTAAGETRARRSDRRKRAIAGTFLVGVLGASAFALLGRSESSPSNVSDPSPTGAQAVPPAPDMANQEPAVASGAGSSGPGALSAGARQSAAQGAAGAASMAPAESPGQPPPSPGQTKVEAGDITTGNRSPVSGGNREGGGSTEVTTGKITTGDKSGADLGNIKGAPGQAASAGVRVKTGDIKTGDDSPVTIGNTTEK